MTKTVFIAFLALTACLDLSNKPINLLESDAALSQHAQNIVLGKSKLKFIPRKLVFPVKESVLSSTVSEGATVSIDIGKPQMSGIKPIFSSDIDLNLEIADNSEINSFKEVFKEEDKLTCNYSHTEIEYNYSSLKFTQYRKFISVDRHLIALSTSNKGLFVVSQRGESLLALSLARHPGFTSNIAVDDIQFENLFLINGSSTFICLTSNYFAYLFEVIISENIHLRLENKFFLEEAGDLTDCFYDFNYLITSTHEKGVSIYNVIKYSTLSAPKILLKGNEIKTDKFIKHNDVLYITALNKGLYLYDLKREKMEEFLAHPYIQSIDLYKDKETDFLGIYLENSAESNEFFIEARVDNPRQPTLNRIIASSEFVSYPVSKTGKRFTYFVDRNKAQIMLLRRGVPNVIEIEAYKVDFSILANEDIKFELLVDASSPNDMKLLFSSKNEYRLVGMFKIAEHNVSCALDMANTSEINFVLVKEEDCGDSEFCFEVVKQLINTENKLLSLKNLIILTLSSAITALFIALTCWLIKLKNKTGQNYKKPRKRVEECNFEFGTARI